MQRNVPIYGIIVPMDARRLTQFVHLAESLHFGRASERSHVSPSALSRSIRQLEDDVGAVLFERDNRSVALTHEGELFLPYARDALAQWSAIRQTLMAESGELHGEVSIYCSVTASYSFLFELLSAFRRDHPRIEIKLHTGDPEYAIARVRGGDEDMAIGAKPDQVPGELAFRLITISPLVFIAPRDAWADIDAGANDWTQTPMILSERGLSRRRLDAWFDERGIEPNIYAQVAGNEAIVSMVSLGFGVGVVPRIVLDNSPLADSVRILTVRPELEPYQVGLFTTRKKLRNPLIKAFWAQFDTR